MARLLTVPGRRPPAGLGVAAARLSAVTGAVTLLACPAPREAPTELADLSLFFFAEFETGDDTLLGDALANLEAVAFAAVDLGGERVDRQWGLPVLGPESRGGAVAPAEVDPEAQVTVAVAWRSTRPISDHALGVLRPDQSTLEPSAPEHDRTFPGDTACWRAEDCLRLDTLNDVLKSNLLYEIRYETEKDYRRFVLPDGRAGMAARTWNDEVAVGDEGRNSIDQNYAIDLFLEAPDDAQSTIRMMGIWTSVRLSIDVSDEVTRSTIAHGIQTLFERHDSVYASEGP